MGTKFNEQIEDDQVQEEATEAKEDQEESQDELDDEETSEDTSTSENTDDEESDEEESDDESEEEEVVEDDVTEKEVEGLANTKKVLSDEIVELRKERRNLRQEEKTDEVFIDKKEDLSDIADSDVELIEKVLKSKGYVKKEDQYKSTMDDYKNAWLEDHPEYLPENDIDDALWNKLKKGLDLYKSPKNPKDVIKLLNRVDKEINPKASIPVKGRAKTEAAKKKIETSSKGGGGKGKSTSTPKTKTTVDRSSLSGFTEEELDEMGL